LSEHDPKPAIGESYDAPSETMIEYVVPEPSEQADEPEAPDAPIAGDAPLPRLATVPLVAIAVVAVIIGPAFDGEDPAPSAGTPEIPAAEFDTPAVAEPVYTPDDGDLKIVEFGYSELSDLSDDKMVSWAAVVENTSADTAVTGMVAFDADTKSGDRLGDQEYPPSATVPLLLPGERTAVGSTDYLERGGLSNGEVVVTEPQWWSADALPYSTPKVTADQIETARVGKGQTDSYWSHDGIEALVDKDGDLTVHFRVDSESDKLYEDPTAMALFRDKDGDILGASNPLDFDSGAEFPPGWSMQTLVVKQGPPKGTDEDAVEIYLYPGSGV
jgi:hypothetical protein